MLSYDGDRSEDELGTIAHRLGRAGRYWSRMYILMAPTNHSVSFLGLHIAHDAYLDYYFSTVEGSAISS